MNEGNINNIRFLKVHESSGYFSLVEEIFQEILTPLYGNQEKSIQKAKEPIDRICELMLVREKPVGLIIYKNHLQTEYGLKEALELKTLLLLDPEKNSGNGYGSILVNRIEIIARCMNARLIFCTCSPSSKDSFLFIKAKGYQPIDILKKNNNPEAMEILLTKHIK